MNQVIEPYTTADRKEAVAIWNTVVEDGMAFPQEDVLTEETGEAFFQSQSFTGISKDAATGEIVGLYILHPNNVGRCGHICNASYAVKKDSKERASESSWYATAWRREKNWASAFCNLTP